MADTRSGGAFLAKFIAVIICLGIAALGTWMIIDPIGFAEGITTADTDTSTKARVLKQAGQAMSLATERIGVRPTGAILAALGLGAIWLVMRPNPQH